MVSVPTFHSIGALVEGSELLATVPGLVAREVMALRPNLRTATLPLTLGGAPIELQTREGVKGFESPKRVL